MEKLTTLLSRVLFPIVFSVASQVAANQSTDLIRDYITATYGKTLTISKSQIEQLSWVIDNPTDSPERSVASRPLTIHREVPRTLARLYCLQLLRSGSHKDYEAFIQPQKGQSQPPLTFQEFKQLSDLIKNLDNESYDTVAAAAIISAVTLSPTAKDRAGHVLKVSLPEDSVKFLSLTATRAAAIYPLAAEVIKKYHSNDNKFKVVFLSDSHLRHMMYNEGSLSMYTRLRQGFKNKTLSQGDLNLWYAYWADNIAGFRGHLNPKGSLYLTANTYRAMNLLKIELDKLQKHPDSNPMVAYLQKRAQWLELNKSLKTDEQLAMASLAASMRLFSPEQGKLLIKAFKNLSATDQLRWLNFTRRQRTDTGFPSPTYAPAMFDNALIMANMAEALPKVLHFYLNVMDKEAELRKKHRLGKNTPVSFRVINHESDLKLILSKPSRPFTIDTRTGLVQLQ